MLSREGANVSIIKENNLIEETKGEYGEEGFVFQEYMNLENEFGFTALIGSWIIGGEAAGIGIRESKSKLQIIQVVLCLIILSINSLF